MCGSIILSDTGYRGHNPCLKWDFWSLQSRTQLLYFGFGLWHNSQLLDFYEDSNPCDINAVQANAVLKGTTSDDFYNCHSRNNSGGAFEHISFREFVSRGFTAMDIAALNICEESHIPGQLIVLLFLSFV